jgi:hypothetical protein
MKPCRNCGQDIDFRIIKGVCTPIHPHGLPCGERAPYSDEALRGAVRCRCQRCRQMVYLVRHNGGAFWVDELGWPWPPHPCFDTTAVPLSSVGTVEPATMADFEHALYLKLNEIPADHRRRQNCIHEFTRRGEFKHLSRDQMEKAGVELLKEVERPAIARGRQRSVPRTLGRRRFRRRGDLWYKFRVDLRLEPIVLREPGCTV